MQVIAIDGPAGAGKSTVARAVAEALGWAYLDTGAMYRALTWLALEEGVDLDDEEALAALTEEAGISLQRDGRVLARGQDVSAWIRTARITQAVSTVAGHAEVRTRILPLQRAFPEHAGPVVAEGRDMGTVVFPEAAVKVFLEADPAERARRRLAQGSEGRAGDDVARMQARLEARDRQDAGRAVAPLKAADDAWRLDTTAMTLDEVVAAVLERVRSAVRR